MATATLSAVFRVIDEMSSIMDRMADTGSSMSEQWESAGTIADQAFATAVSGADEAANAMEKAASSQDYWTSAVGNYNKSAMEASFSTAELVEMGMKSSQALEDEAEMARLCAQSADFLTKATDASTRVQEQMAQVSQEAAAMSEKLSESDKVSTEVKADLTKATENLQQASIELAQAHEEAAAAAEELARATNTVGTSQEELEKAAEGASIAATRLAEANGNATRATDELADATRRGSEEYEKNGSTGSDAIKQIEAALVAAGLTKLLSEITNSVIEMTNAFSEAESVIVKATGASGEALDSMSASMMRVYATTKDSNLSNVAGAVGEINTRLGLMDETLEHSTTLFMDYARITGSDVVGSVQNVTKVMKNWGVEVEDMEGLMDKLAYGGQAAGISVDALSDTVVTNKATLQQLGYSLDESIALISMMEYEGLNASSVMMGFRSAVTNFADAGLDASVAMQETIEQIGNMADESEATAYAIDVFGSRAGAELAFAIRNSKFEIEDWIEGVSSSEGTLASTAEAATTLGEKWTQASNSLSTAFTSVMAPVVEGVSSKIADFVQGIGDFLNKNPLLTAALSAAAIGLGVVVVAIVAFSAAMAIASVVTTVFSSAAMAALWPITLVVAAIAALVALVVLLGNLFGNTNEEFNALSASSKQQYEELGRLNDEYERTVEEMGETSAEAQLLRMEIAELEDEFESCRFTLQEFVAENDALIKSHDALADSYRSGMREIDKEEKSALSLIGKLQELGQKTNLTATEQQQMSAIVGRLNDMYPELNMTIDDLTGAFDKNIAAIRQLAEAQAAEQRVAQQYESYVDLIAERAELEDQLTRATNERIAAEQRQSEVGGMGWFGSSKQAKKDLEAFVEEEERLSAALAECDTLLAETEEGFYNYAVAAEEAELATVDYETAVNSAIQSVAGDMQDLIEAYDKAYEGARSSIDSTIGLFDKMATECEISTRDMLASWQSQVDYLELYAENLRKAAEYGIDDGLIASLSDGSEESAGYIDAIVAEYERLEAIGEDASAFVGEFNEAFQEVETAKDEWATTVAEMETDFNNSMDEIQSRMEEAIGDMSMETEAADAARETIQAYIDEIKSMTGDAHSAAEGVARAATSALGGKGISTVGIPGYAVGTMSADPGLALVGENGPELVNFGGGEVVYTADETSRILSAGGSIQTSVPESFNTQPKGQDSPKTLEEKKITLDINGSGEFAVGGQYDEDTIWNIMASNLKPVLMNLIKQEIYEEGDLAHEF